MTSPIETLIDQACVRATPEAVLLSCPDCKRTMVSSRRKGEPEKAVLVECLCPSCVGDGIVYKMRYFDEVGTEISG